MLCSSCTRWDCLPEDNFCGFCGFPAKRLELSPPAAVFVGGARAKPLRLTLANRGTSPLKVRIGQPRATREWLKIGHPAAASETERKRVGWTKMVAAVEDGRMLAYPHIDAEVNLPPGADYGFDVSVEGRLAIPEKDLSSVLLLSGEGLADLRGNPVTTRRVAVTWGVPPEPRLNVTPEVICRLGGRGTSFDVRVSNPRRGFLTLREVPKVSVPWISVQDFPAEPILPGQEAAISLASDPNWAPPGTHKVEVSCWPLEVEKPLTASFTVHVRMPPQLLVRTSMTFADLTPYSEVTQQLVLENRGEEDLLLLGEPVVEPARLRANVRIRDDDPTHKRIKSSREGNRGKAISIVASGRGLAPGEHSGTIRIASNDSAQEVSEVRVTLFVKQLEKTDRLLALDFGTSNSCIAVAHDLAHYEVVDLSRGAREKLFEIPTVAYFKSLDEVIVGEQAKNLARMSPDQTVSSIKRSLGSSKPLRILGRDFTPGDIASRIIRDLWERAAVELQAEPHELVITVPCNFGPLARETLLEACRKAGFAPRPEPEFVLDEPAAAAFRYLLDATEELSARESMHKVLVYDFGGGTLDIALLEVHFAERPRIYVKFLGMDGLDLGGDDLDQELFDLYLERLTEDQAKNAKSKVAQVDLDRVRNPVEGEADLDAKTSRSNLRLAAEEIKKKLSSETEVPFPKVLLKDRMGGTIWLDKDDAFLKVTRAEFEARVQKRLAEGTEVVTRLLQRADVSAESIGTLLLTGGSSRMPLVHKLMSQLFPRAKIPTHDELPPKQSVALGAVKRVYLAKYETSRMSGGPPDIVIEPMKDRAFFSLGTTDAFGRFTEIIARGVLPLTGDVDIPMPPRPVDFPLVRNDGGADQRFREKSAKMREVGSVRIDPALFPDKTPGKPVKLNLFLHEDRRLEATIETRTLAVHLREGALT